MALSFKKNLVAFVGGIFFLALIFIFSSLFAREDISSNPLLGTEITVGGIPFSIEVVDTETTRMRGLSGREWLAENEGMLFVFQEPDFYGFWMKDMRFPIDIIWLDEDFGVIDIIESVSPETFPTIFYPPKPVRFVLEISAGGGKKISR